MAEIYPASVILSILLCHSEAQPKNLFYAPPGVLFCCASRRFVLLFSTAYFGG